MLKGKKLNPPKNDFVMDFENMAILGHSKVHNLFFS
jgi:hypothetical protein